MKVIKKIIVYVLFFIFLIDYNDLDLDNIKKLKDINKDIIGTIIYCNREDIILHSYDNNYYMYHNYLKSRSYSGEIFLDYRNSINDKILIIYGHSSDIFNTSFSILKNYLNEVYYLNNRYIKIKLVDKYYVYKLVSIFIEDNDFSYLKLNINDYDKHYNYLLNKSIYDNDINLDKRDRVLIIQTCYEDKYLVLVSKLVEEVYYG